MNLKEKNIIGFRILFHILIALFVLFMFCAYWLFWPFDVLTINREPVPATQPENIKSGRVIFLNIDYCKHSDAHGLVERTLVSDRMVIDLPSYQDRSPKGCGRIEAPIILPYTVATQRFHIHYKVVYQVNPLRKVVEEFNTTDFDILPVPISELQEGE